LVEDDALPASSALIVAAMTRPAPRRFIDSRALVGKCHPKCLFIRASPRSRTRRVMAFGAPQHTSTDVEAWRCRSALVLRHQLNPGRVPAMKREAVRVEPIS